MNTFPIVNVIWRVSQHNPEAMEHLWEITLNDVVQKKEQKYIIFHLWFQYVKTLVTTIQYGKLKSQKKKDIFFEIFFEEHQF